MKIKPLSLGDSLDIEKMVDSYPSNRVAPKVTWRVGKQIVSIDGNNDRGMIGKFIETMPIMDSKFIRNFLRENQPSLDLKKSVQAPSGELVSFEIAFGVEFFRPFF